jgi:hypothetical protein
MKISLDRCKKLIDSGLSLITIGDKKIPNTSWKITQTVALTKNQFEQNYLLPTTNGVGIVTGYNNIEVIDIDLKILPSLKMQQDFWNEYISFLNDNIDDFDNKFVIYKTVNNGYHILYKCEEIGGNQKIAKLKEYKEAIIETRGNGGYVFIYENKVSKRDYTDIQEISVKDREVLFQCSKYYNHIEDEIKIDKKVQKESIDVSVSVWDDYNDRTSVWELIEDEFDVIKKLSNKTIIRRHGATSAHSGYLFHDKDLMFLFTTGTQYPNEKGLNPFAVYTYKNHKGDWSASAKELYSKGYGSRVIKEVESLSKAVKIDKKDLEFPIDIFPIKIQNYLIECNKTLDSSIDFMGCSLIWLISVIIGNSFKIQVKAGWIESVNVWISIVGKAGIGKTPSISHIIQPLSKLNNTEIKTFIKQYKKYETYIELDKKEKDYTEEIKKPTKTQFIVNDITQEALIELHEENKNSVGVFKDELAGWFKDMNKYRAGSDLEFWLSSWSNKGITLNRKTAKSSFVESPIIPVLGGIQPTILTQFFTEENKDNGFIDRMLTCFPELEVDEYNENEMSDEILNWYNDYIVTFYQLVKKDLIVYNSENEIESYICKYDAEARIEWKRIFNEITSIQNSEFENEYMKSMLPKQKSYIPRFATIIHLFDHYDNKQNKMLTITKDSVLKAEKLSKYFINMAKKIKIDSAVKNDAKKIMISHKDMSNKEKCIEILKSNPEMDKKDLAELLGVSLQMIYKYVKC